MFEYFVKGGVVMYPLLACSIISTTIIIERLLFFYSVRINTILVEKIVELIGKKEFEKATKLLDKTSSIIRTVFTNVIKDYYSPNFEARIKDVIEQQLPKLERYLALLAAIASVATLLGFTGTVTGMIRAFESISSAGYASPQIVAKGIAEALITTAAGLFIAIPTISFYHYFNFKVNRFIHSIEHFVNEIISSKK